MINKQVLQSFISKYHLNGLNNQVKWRIEDNTLTVYAGKSGLACKVVLPNFQFEDCELGIFDTNKLQKLIAITSGDLILNPIKTHKIYSKLNIEDQNFDVNYSLADTFVIGKAVYYPDLEEYEIKIELDNENISNLIKAKSALPEQSTLLVKTIQNLDGELICEFTFGDIESFSNKVTYTLQGNITEENIALPFNSDVFKDILAVNKDTEKGIIKITSKGMMQLNFKSEEVESEYFLARNE